MKNKEFLGKDNIKDLLIKLSKPAVIAMIVNSMYNLVDAIFVGKGAGALALGGLAIAWPIQMTIMAVAMGLGVGAASIVSRALGSKEYDKGKKAIGNTFVLVTLLNILIAVFGNLFLDDLLLFFGSTENILPYARDYVGIVLGFNIFYGFSMSFNNLVRAEGKPDIAAKTMLIGIGTNIILDPIFIFDWGLGLGVKGAALATGIGQVFSFIYLVQYILRSNTFLKVKLEHLKLNFKVISEIIAIGLPSFIRNFAGSFIAILVNNKLGFYGGDIAISVYGTVNKVIMFLFMPAFGIVQGLQPIVGYNYGAKKYDRVISAVSLALKVIIGYFFIAWLLVQIAPNIILRLFTNEKEFIDLGANTLRIMIAVVPVVAVQIVSSTLFQGIGKAGKAMVVSLSRQFILFIPLLFILTYTFGLNGVWLTYPAADLLSSIIAFLIFRHEAKILKSHVNEEKSI